MVFVMKVLVYIVIGILVVIGLYFAGLSVLSRKAPKLGMLNNQLRACPPTPNCVSSEQQGTGDYVEPLKVKTTIDDAWRNAKMAVVESGGHIMTEHDGYLRAYFVTPLMRYVDDVELRRDLKSQVIQIRSASRVGRSDLGANRSRVAKIRMAFVKLNVQDTSRH
jgi:uncharacterized protein (DUF1499 family)